MIFIKPSAILFYDRLVLSNIDEVLNEALDSNFIIFGSFVPYTVFLTNKNGPQLYLWISFKVSEIVFLLPVPRFDV
jgi:hypothetical protein